MNRELSAATDRAITPFGFIRVVGLLLFMASVLRKQRMPDYGP